MKVILSRTPVSHRDADRIVVLTQGQVVETGTHDTLLEMEGTYARMWMERQKAAEWTVSSGSRVNGCL